MRLTHRIFFVCFDSAAYTCCIALLQRFESRECNSAGRKNLHGINFSGFVADRIGQRSVMRNFGLEDDQETGTSIHSARRTWNGFVQTASA